MIGAYFLCKKHVGLCARAATAAKGLELKKNHAIPNEEFGMPNLFHQSDRIHFDQTIFCAKKLVFQSTVALLLHLFQLFLIERWENSHFIISYSKFEHFFVVFLWFLLIFFMCGSPSKYQNLKTFLAVNGHSVSVDWIFQDLFLVNFMFTVQRFWLIGQRCSWRKNKGVEIESDSISVQFLRLQKDRV